jgi:hypothetical protein
MTDLVEFLRAALDEDERVALEAVDDYYYLDEGEATLRFLEHHDPARVLAEVAAKRAIVDVCAEADAKCPADDWPDEAGMEWAALSDQARYLLRLLAQPYAGRPGWQEEWRT